MGDDKIHFQPYGKDEFYINLVSDDDFWVFGPCDTSNFDPIHENSGFHSYIRVYGKNLKYYNKNHIVPDFKLRPVDRMIVTSDSFKKISKVNELYVFLVYNYKDQFVHLSYTPSYEEFCEIEKLFNVVGSMFIIGDEVSVVEDATATGLGISVEDVEDAILDIQEEAEEDGYEY